MRVMLYSVGIFRTSSPGDSISSNSENCSMEVREGARLKKTRYPKLRNLVLFLCMGGYKSLGSLKAFLWYVPQVSRPVSYIFTSWVPSGLTVGSGCSPWLLDGMAGILSFLSPSRLTITGSCICWCQWPPLLTDVKVLDFFLSTNDISNFLKDLYHPGSIYVLTSAKVTPHICHGPCYSQAQQVWIQLCHTEHETFGK